MTPKTIWQPTAFALILLASACTPKSDAPSAASAPFAVAPASAASTPAPAPSVAPAANVTGQCGAAQEVLASCAYENTCSSEMTLYLPAAARDRLVTLEKAGGFSREAFDRYCEQVCRHKSPQVDPAAFASEVCPGTSATSPSKEVGASASPLKFQVGKLMLDMAPVELAKVKDALGTPLKSEPSPYQCDSAYESEGTRLLTFRGAVFESDGKTAVLRRLLASASADVQWQGLPGNWADLTLDRLQAVTGVGKLQVDDHTLRLAPAPGASLETGWDFGFQGGHLNSVTHWIGC